MRKAHDKEQEDAAFSGVVHREFMLLGGTADLWMEMTNRCFEEAEKHAEMTGCESPCNGMCPDENSVVEKKPVDRNKVEDSVRNGFYKDESKEKQDEMIEMLCK